MIAAIDTVSKFVRKYVFSKSHGKPFALLVLICTVLIFLYGAKGEFGEAENLTGGFTLSFGFVICLYFALYAVANEPLLFGCAFTSYGLGQLLDSIPLLRQIANGAGAVSIFIIFIKWANAINDPSRKAHRDDF